MTLEELVVAILLAGIAACAILGGADFGAGLWDLTAGGAERGARIRRMVKSSMGPVWEANHVWLIFVLVVFWTGFPKAIAAVMDTLYVPLFLAALGIHLPRRRVCAARRGRHDRGGAGARSDLRGGLEWRTICPLERRGSGDAKTT